MKAAQISEYGHADKIHINEIDVPRVGSGQVLINVHAVSLNPFDTMVREGYVKDLVSSLPITLGGDFAGVVAAIGSKVHQVAIGDKVYGQANVVAGNSGAFAQYAVTSANQIALSPSQLTFPEAAALPLVSASAYQALYEHIKLKKGERLFIHGGAGGIGSIAIQIAKHIGAYVAASARNNGVKIVSALGADVVINSDSQDFIEIVRDYNAVFDTVGGEDFTRSLHTLAPHGRAVTMSGEAVIDKGEHHLTVIRQSTHVTTKTLDAVRGLVEANVIKPQVAQVYPLSKIRDAFETREAGGLNGKIVVEIK